MLERMWVEPESPMLQADSLPIELSGKPKHHSNRQDFFNHSNLNKGKVSY